MSWQGSNWPVVFDLGVLVEAPVWLLTIYLFLAFPMGRIEPRAARWPMCGLGLGALFTFLPWALLTPVIAGGGPLTRCAPDCPANALQIGSHPKLAEVAGKAEIYIALTLAAVVFVLYLIRLLRASRASAPVARRGRRHVAPAPAGVVRLQLSARGSWSSIPETLQVMAWVIVGTRILLPLGFLDRAPAGRALRRPGAPRPARAARRPAVAGAVARLGGRGARRPRAASSPTASRRPARFREASGRVLTPAALRPHQAWVADRSR